MKVFGCFLCLSFKIFRNNQKLKAFFLREGSQISPPANDEYALFFIIEFPNLAAAQASAIQNVPRMFKGSCDHVLVFFVTKRSVTQTMFDRLPSTVRY